jgi:hypothetical protein
MRNSKTIFIFALLSLVILSGDIQNARAQADLYPAMAPVDEYLMPKDAEITLARSAAPASVADGATVMVLGRQGYTTAVQGANGFVRKNLRRPSA